MMHPAVHKRMMQISGMIIGGMTQSAVAKQLGFSPSTVSKLVRQYGRQYQIPPRRRPPGYVGRHQKKAALSLRAGPQISASRFTDEEWDQLLDECVTNKADTINGYIMDLIRKQLRENANGQVRSNQRPRRVG